MEERRLLIAVALSLLVLTAYQFLFAPPPKPRPSPSPAASAAPATAGPAGAATPPGPETVSATPAPAAPRVADDRERRVEVQGPDIAVAFSNRGARLLSWRLLHFADPRGRPEEMVQAVVGGPRPLDFDTGDPSVDEHLKAALFQPSSETVTLAGTPAELRFTYAE